MHMRPSKVLKKLRAGGVASSVKLNLEGSRLVELAAMFDFDCIWLDMEHVPTDWSAIENAVRAAKVHDVDLLVRVARGPYNNIIRPLEADASGIMVPHVMSLEDARSVVWQTRFHPVGRRAVDGGNADGAYCLIDFQEYLRTANEQRFVIVQIEDPEPVDELEQIAQLDGIDMIFFGPADFSHGIGLPGQWDHPRITEMRRRIAQVCLANGKAAGTMGSPETFQELVDMGYRFINLGADVLADAGYFKDILASFNKVKMP